MIANGLMVFGLRIQEEEFVEYGLSLTLDLVEQVERYGHLPSIDPQRSPKSQRSAWSTRGVAHLVKATQCFLMAADLGMDRAGDAASSVVKAGLEVQRPDGRIVTHPDDDCTMLHPLLYAVEGLWVYGQATGHEEALVCARRAVGWTFEHRLQNGGFPRFVPTDTGMVGPEQCDATAQFLRAAIMTGFDGDLALTARRICSVALAVEGLGRSMPYQLKGVALHRNVWATMFAVQGCELAGWNHPYSFNWRHLV